MSKRSEWTGLRHQASPDDAVLAVYATQEMFDVLDDLEVATLVAIAWSGATPAPDALQWARTWKPRMLGEIPTISAVELDPVVVEALRLIKSKINLEHHALFGYDETATAQLLKKLHQAGYTLRPEDLRMWAKRDGWNSSLSGNLAAMARKIADGRRVRGTGGISVWKRGIVAHLKRMVADEEN